MVPTMIQVNITVKFSKGDLPIFELSGDEGRLHQEGDTSDI